MSEGRGARVNTNGTFVKENVPDSEQDFDVNDGGEGGEEPVKANQAYLNIVFLEKENMANIANKANMANTANKANVAYLNIVFLSVRAK